ncbi:EAL domain-containing protein, partial [Actinophytocola sp.]|uniref:EAL domain-containing protein n=1 Tax=Actinophytocola sp. TaxID=1872138 RepID=UPI00389B38CC
LAEETGLIVPLGNWVLGAACRQAAQWAREGFAIGMSVNVSARQLHTEDFVATVADTLAESGLPPGRLTLELTESALIRPSALALLHDIRALGVRVALDDFGTGYSSLSYLQRHPFDLIKVDRSFVTQLGEEPTAEGIVRCILDLAAVLNTPVVGEGVETRSQAELLTANGCALAQGYYYGKPAPVSEWTTLTETRTPFRR